MKQKCSVAWKTELQLSKMREAAKKARLSKVSKQTRYGLRPGPIIATAKHLPQIFVTPPATSKKGRSKCPVASKPELLHAPALWRKGRLHPQHPLITGRHDPADTDKDGAPNTEILDAMLGNIYHGFILSPTEQTDGIIAHNYSNALLGLPSLPARPESRAEILKIKQQVRDRADEVLAALEECESELNHGIHEELSFLDHAKQTKGHLWGLGGLKLKKKVIVAMGGPLFYE